MFYLPGQSVTTERLGRINLVDETTARQDIEETGREIQRYHRLTLRSEVDGSYRIEGAALDQRLCLLHALRRGLRLCPQFVNHHFTPALKTQLKQEGIARTLYDDTNLQALVNRCARALNRQFDCRDVQFLRLYLQYCLLEHHRGYSPDFNDEQQRWAQTAAEFTPGAGDCPPLAAPGRRSAACWRALLPLATVYVAQNPRPGPRRSPARSPPAAGYLRPDPPLSDPRWQSVQ